MILGKLRSILALAGGLTLGAGVASASITYTCGPGVAAATCAYLNTTVAGLYSSVFTNANASIYIQYGTTDLAQSQSAFNVVPYSDYVNALEANTHKDAIQISALNSLNSNAAGPYGAGNVNLTAPLAAALGLSTIAGDNGVMATGSTPCDLATVPGCYDASITVTNSPSTPFYYDNLGGPEPSDAYDFYATVEHETDEVLGTASCIDTNGSLSDGCDPFGAGTPSAVDLFRYAGPGSLILDSALSTTPGAYFSFDGGVTNGVSGLAGPKFYNTLANGDDYADFVSSTPDCGTDQVVQDAEGCPGEDAGLNIKNDGMGEIHILNAVGFNVATTPEPGLLGVLGVGFVILAAYRHKRRSRA